MKLWNRKINLTALSDSRKIALLHYVDSLTVFKVINLGSKFNILDVGTGAGFPGMVMRIVDESLRITLMDKDVKKIIFLKTAANKLDLADLRFLNVQLDNLTKKPPDIQYNLIISRAFISDASTMDRLHLLLPPEGLLVRMAGPASRDEKLIMPHFRQVRMWEGELPLSNFSRRILLYKKLS